MAKIQDKEGRTTLPLVLRVRGGGDNSSNSLERPWAERMRPFSDCFTTVGFITMLLSSGALVNYLLGSGAVGDVAADYLFACFMAMLVGVHMIAWALNGSKHASHGALIISKGAAFAWQNLPAVATISASFAAAGIVANVANPASCFGFYMLFITAIATTIVALRDNE